MAAFPEVIERLNLLAQKLDHIRTDMLNGRIQEARDLFSFIISLRAAIENEVFNRETINAKLQVRARNLVEYCTAHLDASKAAMLITDMTACLGLLGSSRFMTRPHTFMTFFDKDIAGVTNGDFHGDPAYYTTMFREHAFPLFDEARQLTAKLVRTLGELQLVEKQRESRLMTIVKTDRYKRLSEKIPYRDHLDLIDYVENKIEDFLSRDEYSNRKVTGQVITGPYQGNLHAWLPMPLGNHRIVYTWDTKTRILTYLTIGTHQELGLT